MTLSYVIRHNKASVSRIIRKDVFKELVFGLINNPPYQKNRDLNGITTNYFVNTFEKAHPSKYKEKHDTKAPYLLDVTD